VQAGGIRFTRLLHTLTVEADVVLRLHRSDALHVAGLGRLNFPSVAVVDSYGNPYVADTFNFGAQVFSPRGEFLFRFGDGRGDIYVADQTNKRVNVYESIEVPPTNRHTRARKGPGTVQNAVYGGRVKNPSSVTAPGEAQQFRPRRRLGTLAFCGPRR
jgi:hypothetical protein